MAQNAKLVQKLAAKGIKNPSALAAAVQRRGPTSDDANKGRRKNPNHRRNMLATPNFNYDYRDRKGRPTSRGIF